MKARYTWRREPSEKGLAGVCQSERGYDLRRNGVDVAYVRPVPRRGDRSTSGWYWHTCTRQLPYRNTAYGPVQDPEALKAECLEWVKANWSEEPSNA